MIRSVDVGGWLRAIDGLQVGLPMLIICIFAGAGAGAVAVGFVAWALTGPARQTIRSARLIKKVRSNLAKCSPFPAQD